MATLFLIIFSAILFGAATSQAAIHKLHAKHHHNRSVRAQSINVAPRRTCDWIGPGARAVYRCSLLDPDPILVAQHNEPQPRCDWIGPGARAVYRCR